MHCLSLLLLLLACAGWLCAAMEDEDELDDDALYGGGLGLGQTGPSHYAMRGGGGGGGGSGGASMLSAEAVWSQKVVHAQLALEPDDDCDDDDSLQ